MNRLFFFIFLLLTSCTTMNSISKNEAVPELENKQTEDGKIYVLRNTGGYGFIHSFDVLLNDELIGKINNSQMTVVSLAPRWNSLQVKVSGFVGDVDCNRTFTSFQTMNRKKNYFFVVYMKKHEEYLIFDKCLDILRVTQEEFFQIRKKPLTFTDSFIEEAQRSIFLF